MKDFREIVKENKKRALSIAVATAFLVSGPLGFAGCYNPQERERRRRRKWISGGGLVVEVIMEDGIVLVEVHQVEILLIVVLL